jgi:NAD(P)-dependent dehydrogenase (short-subunit alcohol dehydrogenase family)
MIAVVTGASRGAGKGIAIALGQAGMTVYVTGRSVAESDSPFGGSVSETAQVGSKTGGKGIAVALDHADDEAVATFFARVKQEQGRLDILVNNAAKLSAAMNALISHWERRAFI